jgi:hypothetical protein
MTTAAMRVSRASRAGSGVFLSHGIAHCATYRRPGTFLQ